MSKMNPEDFLPKMPEVKRTKSGYEIRAEILEMAKQYAEFEYHAKFHGWELSVKRDEQTGQAVTTVGMPEVPGLQQILDTAEKMYSFVNRPK